MRRLVYGCVYLYILLFANYSFAYSLKTIHVSKCYNYAQIPATVISQHTVYISSKLTGYIKNLHVDIGEKVKKGQILFIIDPVQTYQTIKQAKANLNHAKFIFNRMKKLYKQKVISKDKFIETKSMFLQAKAQYKKTLNLLKYTIIKAPCNGIVVKRFLTDGDLAVASQPVLELIQTNNYLILASIPDSIFNKIKLNQKIEININNKTLNGTVRYIDIEENPITHSHKIKIKPQYTNSIYPGQFCTLKIKLNKKQCILIPLEAKTQRGSINGVFVVKHDKAYFRKVSFGKIYNNKIEALSGLNDGEKIIINPPYTLINNSPISQEQ
ncbi:efflux RND transporter periplasmic adaptor subunit [Hippea jasoniae]|uniref:efflux RND transporter periplasmic adaptor subunit n=1 Tax=Hippea jasoniae TaxID=944479 RepID=UPI000551EA34|nr:efflux RND transporter periplasmic adaptor subunit [Hippea jasoniae]